MYFKFAFWEERSKQNLLCCVLFGCDLYKSKLHELSGSGEHGVFLPILKPLAH